MKTIIYRIFGNELPPRHDPNQAIDNLKFFLEHELELPNCTKVFCLNRILDRERESILQKMLRAEGLSFFTIPICREKYVALSKERDRIRYLTNINAARNQCIDKGLLEADWVFPLDGGTFVRADGWEWVQKQISVDIPGIVAVLTWRAESYAAAVSEKSPAIRENYVFSSGRIVTGIREVSLGFSHKADVRFDSSRCYGAVDKAELLWRLGIKGVWDQWSPEIRKDSLRRASVFSGKVPIGGSVCCLPAGVAGVEGTNRDRGVARRSGLVRLLKLADANLGRS